MRHGVVVAAGLVALAAHGQPAPGCGAFLGSWSGTWSQGYYGTQWIHVTAVSGDCIAQVAYNPTGADIPQRTSSLPVRDGVIEFPCNSGTGGTCRLQVVGAELRARYSDPSGFVNEGIFHKLTQ